MARDSKVEAALALHRFGLGPRAGSVAAIASDPRGALIAEIDRPGAGRIGATELMSSGAAARAAAQFRQAQRQMRRDVSGQNDAQPKNAERPKGPAAPPVAANAPQQIYLNEAKARLDAALAAEIGFAERLVWFWSNHFCVSADKALVRPIAGAFEREAIRVHVLGRFADMLQAAESHPAMLIYLDNARSIGPNSQAGRNRGRGLNENLAREILELHTLGVRSDYTQHDVTAFAKVITGWTVIPFSRRSAAANSTSIRACTSLAGRSSSATVIRTAVSSRAAPCSTIWRAIRPPRGTSRASSRAISSPRSRRPRWSTA